MGAWIEIDVGYYGLEELVVAPFMGAWIEINNKIYLHFWESVSHPSWVRGLK